MQKHNQKMSRMTDNVEIKATPRHMYNTAWYETLLVSYKYLRAWGNQLNTMDCRNPFKL